MMSVKTIARAAEVWTFGQKHALHGIALCRIITALCVFGLLATNFSHRSVVFGPGSIWAEPARTTSRFPTTGFVDGISGGTFTLIYLLVMAVAVAFVIGWHTRIAGVLTLAGFILIVAQNPLLSGAGDSVIRMALVWLVFLNSSSYWALDVRRRARTPRVDVEPEAESTSKSTEPGVWRSIWNSHPLLAPTFTNGIHNVALIALVFQTLLIYVSAGMYKVQSDIWSNGTALYYAIQTAGGPFAWLDGIFNSAGFVIGVATYAVILLQLFFAPLMVNRISRLIVLVLAVVMNLCLAVFLGQPLIGFAMIALLAVLVTEREYETMIAATGPGGRRGGDWFFDRYYDGLDVVDWVREHATDAWYWIVDKVNEIRSR